MEGERGFTRSIIDELHSWDIKGDKMVGESGVNEVSLMNFILQITKEIKWKVKVVLLKVSLVNSIPPISNEIKVKLKLV